MSGTDNASMVPGRFDVVLDGWGFVTARAVDPNMPFRVQQQMLSYSPTFVERQNVSNSYGDNAQDFFLTIRQRDWSLGEQQKYFRPGNDGRYWQGSNVDITIPGQVTLSPQTPSLSMAGTVIAGAREAGTQTHLAVASATNLYRITLVGTVSDLGAHGLGAIPARFGVTSDGYQTYLTTTAAGTVGVRRFATALFGTFSASPADAIAFVNNTLYGLRNAQADLVRWDAAGTLTSVFPWKAADGTTVGPNLSKLEPFGGKLLILMQYGQEVGAELWIYDGVGCSRLEVFPPNFWAHDLKVLYGVAYISGSFSRPAGTLLVNTKPSVLFYDGSQIGKLWEASSYSSGTIATSALQVGPHPALGINDGRLLITDENTGNILAYNPALGGISTIGTIATGGNSTRIVTASSHVVFMRNTATSYYYPSITYNTTGYVISSLIDFDSSLPKQFRGVKVEWEAASDGDGGSVDIAYQVDSLTGSWTTLHTGAVSGTEYTFSNISGHAIAVRITINKGTSTAGPILKSCSVRGAPVLTSYRINEYILDLGGDSSGQNPVMLRDNMTYHPLSGEQMHTNLATVIQAQAPVTVTDRSGTFTAMLEPSNCEFDLTRPGQWYARVRVREV